MNIFQALLCICLGAQGTVLASRDQWKLYAIDMKHVLKEIFWPDVSERIHKKAHIACQKAYLIVVELVVCPQAVLALRLCRGTQPT